MKIAKVLLKNKAIVAAIIAIAKALAKELGLDLNAPQGNIDRHLGVNRTYVYEVCQRVVAALRELSKATPGRPRTAVAEASGELSPSTEVRLQVLEYRVQHPGAVNPGYGRDTYSDGFKYFLLNYYDDQQERMTQAEFAQAAQVPIDTLRDWLKQDRAPLMKTVEKPQAQIPVDAPEIARQIADHYERWEGSSRAFIGHMARSRALSTHAIRRLMQILRLLPLRKSRPVRYRGSTVTLAPGTMLVTDGKKIHIELSHSQSNLSFNWQAMIDQTTGTSTGFALTDTENAKGILEAFETSLYFMGGQVPQAILYDNKPCYDDAVLNERIKAICETIRATPLRPENKAVLEGAFSLYQKWVGTIRLDDSSMFALIHSAVREIIRVYTIITNHIPRVEFNGKSRVQAFYQHVTDPRQQARDQAFLKRLKAAHQDPFKRIVRRDPHSRALLDDIFTHYGLLSKDPRGNLRAYLSEFEPEAIKAAAGIFEIRHTRGKIHRKWAHRYLVKLIQNMQDEIDLKRSEDELLRLTQIHHQNWVHEQQRLYEQLRHDYPDVKELCFHLAEQAVANEVPVASAFWREKLREALQDAKPLCAAVRTHLRRLYQANFNAKLILIGELMAWENGLVPA